MVASKQIAQLCTAPSWAAIRAGLRRWEGAFALLLAATVFSAVQSGTPNIIGIDGYYHIKVAALMREHGPRLEFPWLQLTILAPDRYVDHHFLFHAVQVPFTFGDLRTGAKMAAVIFATLALYTAYAFLAHQRVHHPVLWILALLACAHTFLWRQSMARPQGLFLALLILGVWALFARRPQLFLPLGFVSVWLFDGFLFMLAPPAAACAAVLGLRVAGKILPAYRSATADLDTRAPGTDPWRNALDSLAWVALGIVLGLFTHPYVPRNLEFAWLHLLPKTGLGGETTIPVGREWYPYEPVDFLTRAGPSAGILVLGMVPPAVAAFRRVAPDWRTLTLLALALGMLGLTARSQRLIEYFPAFAVLFCAWSWSRALPPGLRIGSVPTIAVNFAPGALLRMWPLALAIVLSLGLFWTVLQARRDARSTFAWEAYRDPAAWLAANTPPGSRVFTTDWDDFPRLFYWNSHNTYLVGLDPTYMALYDPGLYRLWRRVSAGQVSVPSTPIRENFGAQYVFTDTRHSGFIRAARADPDMETVFRSSGAVILRVRDSAR